MGNKPERSWYFTFKPGSQLAPAEFETGVVVVVGLFQARAYFKPGLISSQGLFQARLPGSRLAADSGLT